MVSLPNILFKIEKEEDEELSQICLPYFNGTTASPSDPEASGQICISVKDEDTVRQLAKGVAFTQNVPGSINLSNDSTSYQNNSGFDAMVIFVIRVSLDGGGISSFEVYDAPTDNSIAAATLRFQNFGGISSLLNAAGERQTIGPIKISNGNFCVINNSTATNTLNITEGLAWVVERAT